VANALNLLRCRGVGFIDLLDLISPDEIDKLGKIIPRMPLLGDDLRGWRRKTRCSNRLSDDLRCGSIGRSLSDDSKTRYTTVGIDAK